MPPRCRIISLPRRSHDPDGVRLGFDFGLWCVEIFVGDRLKRRLPFDTLSDAQAEVDRLVSEGLRRLFPSSSATAEGSR